MLKHICLYKNATEWTNHTTWGGGYCQPHVQLRSDTNEIDFNQIVADDESNLPLMDIVRNKGLAIKKLSDTPYFTKADAANVANNQMTAFPHQTGLTEFTEFRFFTKVTKGNYNAYRIFEGCNKLKFLSFPPSFTGSSGNDGSIFRYTNSLEYFVGNVKGVATAGQAFNESRLTRLNSEYVGCYETKGSKIDISYRVGGPLNTVIFNQDITSLGENSYRGWTSIKRVIFDGMKTPPLMGTAALAFQNTKNIPCYIPKGCDFSTWADSSKNTSTRTWTYIECDRDKFGNLVLPFRLKKYWEPKT